MWPTFSSSPSPGQAAAAKLWTKPQVRRGTAEPDRLVLYRAAHIRPTIIPTAWVEGSADVGPDPDARRQPRIDDAILIEIAARRSSLAVGAPASDGESWSQDEVDGTLAQLDADEASTRAHYASPRGGVAGDPVYCPVCVVPRPCPVVHGLASKYGVSGPAESGIPI